MVFEDGRIVQCVPEELRAWHAGVASWAGEEDINSCSIGVEIVNRGHDWGYPEFPLRSGVLSWEDYLPPLDENLLQLAERYDASAAVLAANH